MGVCGSYCWRNFGRVLVKSFDWKGVCLGSWKVWLGILWDGRGCFGGVNYMVGVLVMWIVYFGNVVIVVWYGIGSCMFFFCIICILGCISG